MCSGFSSFSSDDVFTAINFDLTDVISSITLRNSMASFFTELRS